MTTKKTELQTTYNERGMPVSSTEETNESLCSVELGENAKGEAQVKSVKAYAATLEEAAAEAMAAFKALRSYLADD